MKAPQWTLTTVGRQPYRLDDLRTQVWDQLSWRRGNHEVLGTVTRRPSQESPTPSD
jgi:hypothetical protein